MKTEIRFVLVFAAACLAGVYVHELGHGVAGWLQGIAVVPTPAKEYVLQLMIFMQVANNALFDPLFPKSGAVGVPAGLDPR